MISWWVRGQFSLPFKMTVLPHASGTQMARTARMMGAFHGAMPSTTPAGWRMPMARDPGTSDGITSPDTCVVSAAASRIMPAASITLKPPHMPVAPVSADTASMNAGVLASSASAALSNSARRRLGPVSLQVLKASAAASTAITASAGEAAGARVATLPSSGLRRSKVAPFSAVTLRPLMSMDMSDMGFSLGSDGRVVRWWPRPCGAARHRPRWWCRWRGPCRRRGKPRVSRWSARAAGPGRWPPACRAQSHSPGRPRPAPS